MNSDSGLKASATRYNPLRLGRCNRPLIKAAFDPGVNPRTDISAYFAIYTVLYLVDLVCCGCQNAIAQLTLSLHQNYTVIIHLSMKPYSKALVWYARGTRSIYGASYPLLSPCFFSKQLRTKAKKINRLGFSTTTP